MPVNFEMDWTPIGQLAEKYRQGQERQQTQQWLQQQGLPGNISLAQLALQQQAVKRGEARDTRDFGLRQQQFDLQKRTAEAGLEGAKVPAGFRPTPAGGLAPVPGGPEDPDYLRRKTEATDKGRQMSITDITKLSEEGQKFSDLTRFGDTFKDNYSGYAMNAVGNLNNIAGRNLPEALVGKEKADQATWWQGYDRYKNVVRHELYGAALTKPETAAFEAADITPGMQPEQVRKNLALQKEIVQSGLKRKASAMVAAGYDPKAIGAAFGVDLGSMGVDTTRRGAPQAPGAAPTAPQSPAQPPQAFNWKTRETIMGARQNAQATIAQAKEAVAKGMPPAEAMKRLQAAGIPVDPSMFGGAPAAPAMAPGSAGAIY